MKTMQKNSLMTALFFFIILAMTGASFPAKSFSAEGGAGSASVQLNTIPIVDNLLAFKGKPVTVTLSSGQAITGIVKDAKNGILHLEKISQKEFYDAVILIDRINAVEARVREKL
ncbi:hypothetical protein [Desulforegula conservatrix]|uniref:hypothetical protein n=1 Tax=Desulforegula conservatrix TaxID=153026 RepID=UPI000413BC8C|nr:hypothetical protein [Desulforegula conservatrix]